MKIKAFILRIDDETSKEYAKVCAESCNRVGLEWEYFQGFQNMSGADAWSQTGINITKSEGRPFKRTRIPTFIENPTPGQKAECCSAGHAAIWKRISESDLDVGVVLEHDALMLQPINELNFPLDTITVLGYKLPNPSVYNHDSAGPPKEFLPIDGHEGAHAYAITKQTAELMVSEIEYKGRLGCVDNSYFIRRQRKTFLPLCIASPTPAIGWLRDSTIWNKSSRANYEFIPSFKQHLKL